MINAFDAYRKTWERKDELEAIYKSNVEVLILNAVNQGKFCIYYEGTMYPDLEEQLKQGGYKIGKIKRFKPERIAWEISWDSATTREGETKE